MIINFSAQVMLFVIFEYVSILLYYKTPGFSYVALNTN